MTDNKKRRELEEKIKTLQQDLRISEQDSSDDEEIKRLRAEIELKKQKPKAEKSFPKTAKKKEEKQKPKAKPKKEVKKDKVDKKKAEEIAKIRKRLAKLEETEEDESDGENVDSDKSDSEKSDSEKSQESEESEEEEDEEIKKMKAKIAKMNAKVESIKKKTKPTKNDSKPKTETSTKTHTKSSSKKKGTSTNTDSTPSTKKMKENADQIKKLAKGVDFHTITETDTVERIDRLHLEEEKLKKERAENAKRLEMLTTTKSDTVAFLKREIEDAKREVEKKPSISALITERTEQRKWEFGLDICFLMDCTGSMSSWINQAKEKVKQIMLEAIKIDSRVIPRTAFVGYRDLCDSDRFTIVDFKSLSQSEDLTNALASCSASGGGDTPEDVVGGMQSAFSLDWKSSTKLIIHIADAPCHGKKYHNCDDSYPSGDPSGVEPETLLGKMCNRSIEYFFCRINSTTDIMTKIFAEVYRARNKAFTVHNIGNNPSDFLPKVLASITASMSRSEALKK